MQLFGRPFRPRLWPTVIALPAFIVLLGLGFWQLDRLAEKQALIAELQDRWSEEPVPLPRDLGAAQDWEYRRVRLTGHFLHDKEFVFPGKPYKGTVGFWIATPFVLDDGRGIIVQRGWVPERYLSRASRADNLPEGEVTIEGVVRLPGWKGWEWTRPDNQPLENVWFYVDTEAMAQTAGLKDPVREIYVMQVGDEASGLLPIGLELRVDIPNDHLQYAITWFSLALALAVIYLVFHLRTPGTVAKDATGGRS